MLKIIPLGGLGEIGLNMMVFECGEDLFIVDAGLMFPEDYMLGVDIVIPDFSYLKQNRHKVSGIVLTHAHEDHIGALPFLLKEIAAPVFGTSFTLGMVRHKLEELDLKDRFSLHEIQPGEILRLGSFDIEFVRVRHSVPDGVGLAIQTPYGTIVHTGDFKISHMAMDGMGTDVNRFAQLGEKGVLALLSDSTNVEKEGYSVSAEAIGRKISGIISESRGRAIIALFASNIARIQQIVNIAHEQNRKIIFNGRSIEVSVNIATDLGFLKIRPGLQVAMEEMNSLPDDQVVLITTGSQGEPMSALARMAAGTHRQVRIKSGDTVVFSSKFIPGNEKAIGNIINKLYKAGAEVIYEKISDIHASGHAFREELKLMINLVKPSYFIPIHGEYRHLYLHAKLAQHVGVDPRHVLLAENGQVVEFDHHGGRILAQVHTGRTLIDGKGVGDVGRSVLREREELSKDGLVVVTMAFDEETGVVVYGPEIISKGFVFLTESGYLLQDAQCVVLEIVEEIDAGVPGRVKKIRSRVKAALRQYFFFTIGRNPVILPFIVEV